MLRMLLYRPYYPQFQNVDISTKDPCTLVLLLDSPEVVIICKACESLKKYVDICEFSNNVHIIWNAKFVISVAAGSNCHEVMELGSLPRLTKLLSSTEKVVRSYSVHCLASMAGSGKARKILDYKVFMNPPSTQGLFDVPCTSWTALDHCWQCLYPMKSWSLKKEHRLLSHKWLVSLVWLNLCYK